MAPMTDEAFAGLLRERSFMVTRIHDAEQAIFALQDAGDNVLGPLRGVLATVQSEYEPFELHYEAAAAERNLEDKRTQLATYQSGERPLFRFNGKAEMMADVAQRPVTVDEIRNAQEQVDAAEAAWKKWTDAIAAHPVAAGLTVAEPTSALTPH